MLNSTDYRGYSLFKDVENLKLRTYNRAMMVRNLKEENREDMVRGYYGCLPKKDQEALYAYLSYINVVGEERAKKEVMV